MPLSVSATPACAGMTGPEPGSPGASGTAGPLPGPEGLTRTAVAWLVLTPVLA